LASRATTISFGLARQRAPWASRRPTLFPAHEREHFGGVNLAAGGVARFEVEPQQRLGVARPQVEPPVAEVDGEPVEPVLLRAAIRLSDPLDDRRRVVDLRVDLTKIGRAHV